MNSDTRPSTGSLNSDARPEALLALRALLARTLLDAEPGQVASLSKEYRATLSELEAIAPPERSASDDLAARRHARRATSSAAAPAAGDPLDLGARGS